MGKDSIKENIRKKFYRFLKENGVYRAFINEFNTPGQRNLRCYWLKDYQPTLQLFSLNEYCNNIREKKEIVNYAFSWSDTKQGHDFWSYISEDWKKYCRDNKI